MVLPCRSSEQAIRVCDVYLRSGVVDRFVKEGGISAATPTEGARGADVVFVFAVNAKQAHGRWSWMARCSGRLMAVIVLWETWRDSAMTARILKPVGRQKHDRSL
jgi:hypothetical protein